MNFNRVEFVKSASEPAGFLKDGLPQIVFAGRSNVGKSSTINCIVNRKNFARVSAAPGKTAHINYFIVDDKIYFVDLPGYGYAKVSHSEKERWADLMNSYFLEMERITAGVLIVDIRHKPTRDDVIMANWFMETGCRFIVVANKLDKLKKSEIGKSLELIKSELHLPEGVRMICFSAEKGLGKDELIASIQECL